MHCTLNSRNTRVKPYSCKASPKGEQTLRCLAFKTIMHCTLNSRTHARVKPYSCKASPKGEQTLRCLAFKTIMHCTLNSHNARVKPYSCKASPKGEQTLRCLAFKTIMHCTLNSQTHGLNLTAVRHPLKVSKPSDVSHSKQSCTAPWTHTTHGLKQL